MTTLKLSVDTTFPRILEFGFREDERVIVHDNRFREDEFLICRLLDRCSAEEKFNRKRNHCEKKKKHRSTTATKAKSSQSMTITKRDNNNLTKYSHCQSIPFGRKQKDNHCEQQKRLVNNKSNNKTRQQQCKQTSQMIPMPTQQQLLSILQLIVMSRYCYCCKRMQYSKPFPIVEENLILKMLVLKIMN